MKCFIMKFNSGFVYLLFVLSYNIYGKVEIVIYDSRLWN